MSKFFSKLISSLLNSDQNNNAPPKFPISNDNSTGKTPPPPKIWRKGYNPLRKIVLWGWDDNQNPSFLMLYGRHQFKNGGSNQEKILEEGVKYTSYALFRGKNGHLPSFDAVKIINTNRVSTMYYKKGLRYDYGWSADSKCVFKEFQNLKPEHQIIYPYIISLSHEQYVEKILVLKIQFTGFTPAKSPNEVLKLNEEMLPYVSILTDALSHTGLYMRKKCLSQLLAQNPPKEVYELLLNIGSAEVVSGLFLELAKSANPILLEEAKVLIDGGINWTEGSYALGIKRCASIYINALSADFKKDRISWIRKSLESMDLHLTGINGRIFEPGKILDGAAYRKYAYSGLLKDYYERYDYKNRQYIREEAPQRYKPGPYTNGTKLKLIDFKNTLQEAEVYELPDVIGKMAYFLDSPRLTYYFKGNSKTKALKYFQRYVKRIMNSYAQLSPDKFMEAMINLLTSYTQYDYVCKYPTNFQFNELLRYYLYHDFNQKPPSRESWSARYNWMANDQLLRLTGRHEFKKEIWDNHLDVVADIAIGAKINHVSKACYCILKDSPNASTYIEIMDYERMLRLAHVSYDPLAQMFMNILMNKINNLNAFDAGLMLALIGCTNPKMHELAMEFFQRTNGLFSAQTTADLLLLTNIAQWEDLFRQNVTALSGDQYADFIKYIVERSGKFLTLNKDLPQGIKDILTLSASQVQHISKDQKLQLLPLLIDIILHEANLPEWIANYMEEVIFSFTLEDLESLLGEIMLESMRHSSSARNKRIITVLECIKNSEIPNDSQIIDILDSGSSKMIQMFLSIMIKNREHLNNRFSTLLIMLESEVTVLNIEAEKIFDDMPLEKQKKLHGLMIDSPVVKTYSLALKKLDTIYQDFIPEEFMIQMLEHGSPEVKAYISGKINNILDQLGNGNANLFMYYLKTLLLLPNKISKSKDRVYAILPQFARMYQDKLDEIENILLDIGGSNIIIDSERALVTLAKVRGGHILES